MRGLTLLVAAVIGVGAATPAGARAAPTLKSGSLEASVTEAPFALTLTDTRDGDKLATLAGAPNAPDDPHARYGTLGYSFDLRVPVLNNAYLGYYAAAEAESVWFHATRVRTRRQEGSALVVIADTNDPLGHRLEVTLE